ncbi:BamA/TamA family outer membrane protein [Sphingobacterium sp. SGG-5]|uniref:translocation and assembly module lipoprotein TamL n=1 Tax=Sphingobacterium sp. SGG-5 TaxID=2710881 RepID=UPI0013EB6057|nr:BamA/TamA family outer membrane protein [Sphingobacterium sp. SGG-5]NGM62977.1 BamA/TamA family outer membrane protein [Sphingobacterium sp. SGG-5]
MHTRLLCSILLTAVLFSVSCNSTKYLAEDEKLYDEGKVELKLDSGIAAERKEAFEEHLEEMLMPKPNKKILGWRWKLSLWNMGGGPDTTKNFFRNWLKKMGEEPVLLSDVNREYNENLLRNRVENLGFFNATFSSDTTIHGKLASVTYTGIPRKIYRIKSVEYDIDSTSQIGHDIVADSANTLLKVGRNYNLDVIISERERIDNDLKNKGYYFFNPDNVLVEVDSTVGNHKVDMFITIKPETSKQAKSPQHIGDIYIYPNYTLNEQGYSRRRLRNLELFDNNYYFIDPQNTFRKKVLANHIFFEKDQLYNRHDHNLTISHLVNLNTFKFVKNNFEPNPNKENTLDVYYYLTPMPKKSLRFEILGKTATVYNGSEANVTWTLRNAFRGAETVTLNVFGGYETQTGGNVNLNSSYYRYGAELGISWPRILSPFDWAPSRRFIPKTYLKFGYEFLNRRNAYMLNSSSLIYGYTWKENDQKQHDLSLAEIIYVQPRNITDEYRAQMDTVPTLRHIVEPQFSFGPNYTFTFTNTMKQELKHNFYFKGGFNTSGNVLGLIQGASYKNDNVKTLFNTPYSQFVKVEADFRHYLNITDDSQLASRMMIGTSYSYGNSYSLPYLKQFYSGGPNGLRAFRARSVGPGSSAPENLGENNFFADQTGDYKLELNTEYRAKLAGFIHWAAFVDAGNIWAQHEANYKPGSGLSKDFLSELAVGGGLGLRFDFSFLILRTDFAIPFRVPYRDKGDRWVFKYIDFRSSGWRSENLVFNLAIGYPF